MRLVLTPRLNSPRYQTRRFKSRGIFQLATPRHASPRLASPRYQTRRFKSLQIARNSSTRHASPRLASRMCERALRLVSNLYHLTEITFTSSLWLQCAISRGARLIHCVYNNPRLRGAARPIKFNELCNRYTV
jgi:hypothetical protein